MTITLPIPRMKLSPNGRCHWRTKSKATKAARNFARVTTLQILGGKPPPCPVGYSLHYYWPSTHRDDDNAIASAKAYMDGICGAMGVDDKTLRFRELFHSPAGKRPRLEITLHLAAP
jgi:crossover junction endodeoxyribonuclease RusA